jgi:hypothetical protein
MARIASSRSQKRFRAIWVAQWQFGFVVTPRRCTTRRSISMTNRAQSRPFTASMWKKSVVSMLCALGVKVLRPVRLLPAASRKQPVVAKHVAHGRGRDRDTELAQSAHDAQLTPAGLLLCQSTDQVDVLIGNQRTARSPMRIAPTLPDDPPLPAQRCRRRHDHDRPPAVGKESTGKGEECPSNPSEPEAWRTPLPDLELTAKRDDLDVLLDAAETMNP